MFAVSIEGARTVRNRLHETMGLQRRRVTMNFLIFILSALIVVGTEGASINREDDKDNLIVKEIDIDRTVKEVEDILKLDPTLPRLTRGEILSLIEEVKHRDTNKQRGSKSLMVVLPYTGDSNSSLEELYTKAPVTELVQDVERFPVNTESTIATSTMTTRITTTTPVPVVTTTKRPKRRRKPVNKKPQQLITPSGPVYVPTKQEVTSTDTTNKQADWVPFLPGKGQPATSGEHPQLPPVMQDTLVEIDPAVEPEPFLFVTPTKKTTVTKPTTVSPNVEMAAESLAPDMKNLLREFGLLKPKGKPQAEYQGGQMDIVSLPEGVALGPGVEVSPTVDPTSYMRFKPLPESEADMSEDMRSFLANFGLVPNTRRKNKALPPPPPTPVPIHLKEMPEIHHDMLTPDMRQVLEDLGIMEADRRRRAKARAKHVFNPASTVAAADTHQLAKVNRLLRKIRVLAQDKKAQTLSPEEVKELLVSELGEDAAREQLGVGTLLEAVQPDPLSLDELADIIETKKNEVKRQQPEDDEGATTTSASGTTTETAETARTGQVEETTTVASETTTEPATERTPSFDDLNDSFGGPVSTTTKRPNGLYFLLDWNSFLDVGTEERKVQLNFSPKVGDPSLFQPVTVP